MNGIAQDFTFEVQEINQKDGLPHRAVYDITQDDEGFIWLSTLGAINRYNGTKFKTYNVNFLGISANHSIDLAVDKNNNIWYAEWTDTGKKSKSGIIDTKNDTIIDIYKYSKGLFNSNNILSIKKSSLNKKEWFVSTIEGHIYKYRDTFELIFTFPNGLNFTSSCDQAPDGTYWIGHFGEVFKVRDQRILETFKSPKDLLSIIKFQNQPIFKSYNDRHQFFKLKDGIFYPYTPLENSSNNLDRVINYGKELTYLTIDSFQTLVIQDSNKHVLFQYSRSEASDFLSKIETKTLFVDNRGITWIGTHNGLLKIIKKNNPITVFHKHNSIRGIHMEGDKLWIGSYNQSIFPKGKKIGKRWDLLHDVPITQFSKAPNGHLWFGTTSAYLIEYIPTTNSHILYFVKDRLHLFSPYYNYNLKQLWIGTDRGMTRFDKTTKTLHPLNLPMPENTAIRQFHENEAGLWAVSSKGLFLLAKNEVKILAHYDKTNKLPFDNLIYLYEDAEGIFWIASKGGGLIKWNRQEDTIEQFRQQNGLSNNVLYAIYEDDYNKLWLPSNYGLISFDKNTYQTEIYLPQNGIAHEEFNTFSHFKAKDGTMFFGGLNGITKFHPKDLKDNKKEYIPLFLSQVKVLAKNGHQFKDQTEAYKKKNCIELNSHHQILELELNLLDYKSNGDNKYAYKIEGHQNKWVYTNDNKISIINLPYGSYNLKFKAKGASKYWTNPPLIIPIKVYKPFYLRWWFLSLLIAILIFSPYLIFKLREKQFEKDKAYLNLEVKKRTQEIEKSKETILEQAMGLKKLDQAKNRFFSNITHEFRTPLTLIIGPIKQLIDQTTHPKTKQQLERILKNAQNIHHLINQLLDISKIESNKMKLEVSNGNLTRYTHSLINQFKPLADSKNQNLFFDAQKEEILIHFDKDKWDKIIFNLLSNAIKYTPKGGEIKVVLLSQLKADINWVVISITDTGIGIPNDQIPVIFDRFYQVDDSSTRQHSGTGIGLALVKELVELLGGEIKVWSKVDQGTTFEIQLPDLKSQQDAFQQVNKKFILSNETFLFPPIPPENQITPIRPLSAPLSKEKLKILLIEDNQEMLEYIHSCIDPEKFDVIFANNGLAGINQALKIVPDLIISDIMMPLKNGFEVTQRIRQEIATSHIPIILLTAKAALESKLKGLSRGADAYLTKPFSPEELGLRIEKLIELRLLLQNRFSNKDISNIEEKSKPFEKEDLFVIRVKRFISSQMDNPNLNGQMIAEHFGMSRMQLHRKIKAISKLSISQLIQNIKFEKAIELLKEKEMNISEIAFHLGFSSLHHFSRAFKQKFGKTPSKLQKEL